MGKVLFVSVVIFLFFVYFHKVIEFDQDLGRHLLMGKIIEETGRVPGNNLLSYTHPDFTHVNSHWLAEVVFYQLFNRSGIATLAYLKTGVFLAAMLLTIYTAYRWSQNWAALAVGLAIFSPVLLERTEIRPEMFSYLFIAVFIHILVSYYVLRIKYYGKLVWLLPLLEIFWVNLHIYFVLGPILVTVFLIDRIFQQVKINGGLRLAILNTKYEILSSSLVFLATLFNPNGLSGSLYPFRVFENYGYSIVENQSIFFLEKLVFNPNILYFKIALVAFTVDILFNLRRLTPLLVFLSILVVLPVIHIRSFPLLFLIELPVFAYVLTKVFGEGVFLKRTLLLKKSSFFVLAVILLTLVRSFRLASNQYYSSIDSHKRFDGQVTESGKGAVDFVLTNELRGPIFNNFDVGSYLAYRLYPKERVFVDGRPEAYPADFFTKVYIPMQESEKKFAEVDDRYKFNLIIFSHTDATPWAQTFLKNLSQNGDFSLVYFDSYAVVFVRREVFPNISLKVVEPRDYLEWLTFGQAASLMLRNDVAAKSFEKAHLLNASSPAANQALGLIYSQNSVTAPLGRQYLERYREMTSLVLF